MRRLNLKGLSRLLKNERGSMAPLIAAGVPAVALLAVGATELYTVMADRAKLQDVADAVALDAAQELAFTVDSGVIERTKADAQNKLSEMKSARPQGTIDVVPTIVFNAKGDPEGMVVAVTAHRESFFGNMLPPGGFTTKVSSTALRMGKAPLCILGTSATIANTVETVNSGWIKAGKCLVHSNNVMTAGSTNPLESASAQAVKSASGNILPSALVGAEPIVDPFANMTLWAPPTACSDTYTYVNGETRVPKGRHCSKVMVSKAETVVLEPGEHYFDKGGIDMKQGGILKGTDVVLVYDKDSILDLSSAALVDLDGRRTGPLAGFVLAATRDNVNGFTVYAGNIVNLHGVVYIPSAKLTIQGSGKMAEKSAWTVVVARDLHVTGTAEVFINANYRGSPVPVPKGVGNKAVDKTKNARLKK